MLYIFDWDGTLIDSIDRIVASLRAAIAEIGLETREDSALADIIGLGLPEALKCLYPEASDQKRERLRQAYVSHYLAADQQPSALFPGVRDTLQYLLDQGHGLSIATGKSRRGLDRVLDETGLTGLFHATRCADETASKPDPRMIHELLNELNVAPSAAVMVGDTEYDLLMASNAQVASIGVSYGVHSKERLSRHAPELLIDSFEQIVGWRKDQIKRME